MKQKKKTLKNSDPSPSKGFQFIVAHAQAEEWISLGCGKEVNERQRKKHNEKKTKI